jgi:hypothetical protein
MISRNAEFAATRDDKLAIIEQLRLFQTKLNETSSNRQRTRQVDLQKCDMKDVLKAVDEATVRSSARKGTSVHKFVCATFKFW